MSYEGTTAAAEELQIAIVGNPNCGKTTLFNALTGSTQHIGNWPGVTVEKKTGGMKQGAVSYSIIDLPGIYSLSASSEDERVARDFILHGGSDLIINIVDAANLERNLYLTTQLIEMKVPFALVLNMLDVASRKKITIDIEKLEIKLGVPVIGVCAKNRNDIDRIRNFIGTAARERKLSKAQITYTKQIEQAITLMKEKCDQNGIDGRFAAVSVLEGDASMIQKIKSSGTLSSEQIQSFRDTTEKTCGESPDTVIADMRYSFIRNLTQDLHNNDSTAELLSDRIDDVVLHRFWGLPIFLFVMYLLFWFSISVGGAFIDFFDIAFGTVFVDGFSHLLESLDTSQWLITFLANGIGGGIQTVATFVPIIFAMFFALSILEDSGYMSRAAFVVDKIMHFIGLPGKAFVSMIIGFGCTVPAIMSTRTLDSEKDRKLAIFMSPFMSCGARLPVYVLVGAAFFPHSSGLMVFSLYMTGIILAMLTGFMLTKTLYRGEVSHFIIELPPYHLPNLRQLLIHTWNRLKLFIFRAGTTIIAVVIILSFLNSIGTDGSFGNENTEKSVLATISKTITPVFSPMGIEKENWPATVGIFTGLFAKEAVVGTLSSLYTEPSTLTGQTVYETLPENNTAPEEDTFSVMAGLSEAVATIPENLKSVFGGLVDPLGIAVLHEAADEHSAAEALDTDTSTFTAIRASFSKGSMQAYAYLLFILIYFPCVAALGAIVREVGAKTAYLIAAYLTTLAWVVATLFYQITSERNILWIIVALGIAVAIVALFKIAGDRSLHKAQSKSVS